MDPLPAALVRCPYCGEEIEIFVDGAVDRQEYIEDCSVCCRPMVVAAVMSAGELTSIEVRTEDE